MNRIRNEFADFSVVVEICSIEVENMCLDDSHAIRGVVMQAAGVDLPVVACN